MAAQSRRRRLPVSLGPRSRTNSAHARWLDQRPESGGLSELRTGLEPRHTRVGIGHWSRGADLRFEGQPRAAASIRAEAYRKLSRRTHRSRVRASANEALRRGRPADARREVADCLYSAEEWNAGDGPVRSPEAAKHHHSATR